jgi:hypothetical protein
MTLPKKLGKEPLVEALFEMRFKPKGPVSSILPGLVFTKFSGEKKIENLPFAGLPEQILARIDPNVRYTPLVRIHWDNFMILCSNQSAGLACKLPYPGWTTGFKPAIIKLADLIGDAGIVDVVESVRNGSTDAYQQIHRVNPVQVDFKGPRAQTDRRRLLLHRLFDNRLQVGEVTPKRCRHKFSVEPNAPLAGCADLREGHSIFSVHFDSRP